MAILLPSMGSATAELQSRHVVVHFGGAGMPCICTACTGLVQEHKQKSKTPNARVVPLPSKLLATPCRPMLQALLVIIGTANCYKRLADYTARATVKCVRRSDGLLPKRATY
eukprot:1192305-Prorocentrum_minimum.AAC.5